MKAEMKAVVASLVVIALALTAVSGVTYSWFSDEEKAQVNVTTGTIDLSISGAPTADVDYDGGVVMGTTATAGYNSSTHTVSVDVKNAAPGAKITVTIPTVKLTSTLAVKYYEEVAISGPLSVSGTFTGIKTIEAGDAKDGRNLYGTDGLVVDSPYKFIVTIPDELIQVYKDGKIVAQNFSVEVRMIAVQANAPISTGVTFGGKTYSSLENAIFDAEDGTTLTVSSDLKVTNQINVDKKITLNLDGHTIKSTAGILFNVVGGDLTIKGGVLDTATPFNGTYGAKVTVENTEINNTSWAAFGRSSAEYDCTDYLTMKNVTMKTTGDNCIGGFTNVHITIEGGSYTSDYGSVFLTNGSLGYDGQVWDVSDATFNVDLNGYSGNDALASAIQCHNNDSWKISNCTFNVENGVAISVRGGNVEISDCTYNLSSTPGVIANGKLLFTDGVEVDHEHAIAVSYIIGAYGCDSNSKLKIDGTVVTPSIPSGSVIYFDGDLA